MIRRTGFVLVALGLLLLAWIGVTLAWGDPFTSLYTSHEQHVLAQRLDRLEARWGTHATSPTAVSNAASGTTALRARRLTESVRLRSRAAAYDEQLRDGQPVGRIDIPRIGLNMIFVEGTTESDLAKGPGHYNAASGQQTSLPGLGGVIGIAGHRTTFLHPFFDINEIRIGDPIILRMPYGTFRYRVYAHLVVVPTDWAILRHRPFEKLVLTACHPRYSASHRYVVFARLISERAT